MQETTPIELELRKLGLKEKEARVYLTGLVLGPSSVQEIAKQTNISRPTAYETIKSLREKGLFAETKRNKKKRFAAQSPAHILGVLRTQKRGIEEKEREFIRIIAVLETRYDLKKEGEIKAYKGKEGLKVLEEILSFTPSAKIFAFSSQVKAEEIKKRQAIYQQIKKRLGKIEVKEILSKPLRSKTPQIERKFLRSSNACPSGTLILCDKAIFISSQRPEGLLIENGLLVNLLKSFFLALWDLSLPLNHPHNLFQLDS